MPEINFLCANLNLLRGLFVREEGRRTRNALDYRNGIDASWNISFTFEGRPILFNHGGKGDGFITRMNAEKNSCRSNYFSSPLKEFVNSLPVGS